MSTYYVAGIVLGASPEFLLESLKQSHKVSILTFLALCKKRLGLPRGSLARGHSQYEMELGSQSDLTLEPILLTAVSHSGEGIAHSLGDRGCLRVSVEALTALEARSPKLRGQQGGFLLGDLERQPIP